MGNKKIRTKFCPQCSKFKPREKFPQGRGTLCTACKSKNQYARWKAREELEMRRTRHRRRERSRKFTRLARKYSVTVSVAESWFQDARCQACGATERLAVDHDHDTGEFRGILCISCNLALGLLQESPWRVHGLFNYVTRWYN